MFQVSRKGSRDVADHMAIQMDDSDSITVSEQSEPSAECWQNMYKLLNFYSLISDPTGILEKSSPENCITSGNQLGQFSLLCFIYLSSSTSTTTTRQHIPPIHNLTVVYSNKSAPKTLFFYKLLVINHPQCFGKTFFPFKQIHVHFILIFSALRKMLNMF